MKYLIDLTGCHIEEKTLRTFRFSDATGGYRTAPTDTPANVFYEPRIMEAGEYRTNLFGTGGRTSGAATVDRGDVQLVNNDGLLDEMRDYAFDGYDLTLFAIETNGSAYGTRKPLVTAVLDQIELELDKVTLRLRSRLAVLDQPIQEETYKGTTVAGGMDEAEGTADLKGSLRLLSYGAPKNVPALLLNAQAQIHGVGHKLASVAKVRDRGLILPLSGQDFTTIAALRAATVPDGRVATALNLGLIRIGGNEARGQITVDALEGTAAAERTAGQIVRRILIERAGLVEGVDFRAADISALDAAAPYLIGYWIGQTRMTVLAAVSAILDSVGGWICPDRLGVFRMGRFTGPAAQAEATFTPMQIKREEGSTLRRLSIGEDGKGIPPKKMTLQHSRNHTPVNKDTLAGKVAFDEPDFVTFATTEWRQELFSAPNVEAVHKGAADILQQSALQSSADALAEVNRRGALHAVERDRFEFSVPSRYALDVELGKTYAVRFPRFGLDNGRNFVLTALRTNLGKRMSSLEVWG